MSLDYVQEKIGYQFVNVGFLSSALTAAERDNEKGKHCDGNRGLSSMGVCAMEMVTTRNTIVMFNGTKRDVDTIEHWSKSKRGRASACKSLGLDYCIVQSVRQSHGQPSSTVLAYTLSAIIGAVWFDLERYMSGLDMMNRISEILARIDMFIANNGPGESFTDFERSLSVRDAEDTQESLSMEDRSSTGWNQYPSRLEVPVLQRSLRGQNEALMISDSVASGADFDNIHPSIDLDPFDQFQDTVHDSTMVSADALLGSIQSMDTMRFDSAAAENINDNNPLLELEETTEDMYQSHQISSYTVAGTREASSDTIDSSKTVIALGSKGRSNENRRAIQKVSLHERLIREELAKICNLPPRLHENLTNLLDHDGIDELSSNTFQASQLKLLYFAIGSCQSLRGFKEALLLARGNSGYICHPLQHGLSCAERFQEICRLDDTECLCILLRRFHIVKLFEEEQEVLYPSNMIIVETPSSFVTRQTAEVGNPAVRRKAALTDAVLRKIKPGLREGTQEYRRYRAQVKQMRRLAELLGILTGTYGTGILALLPCRPAYSELSLLENTLSSITEENFRLFSDMIRASQGPVLQKLSKAVEPALTALVNGKLLSSNPFPIEYMEPEVFDELPKGSTEIIKQLSEPISSHQQ